MNAQNKKKRSREKFNFVPWLIVLGVILAIVLGVFIAYKVEDYRDNYRKVYEFVYKDGEYYDKENDITYVAAPYCFSYVLKSGEEYAKSDSQKLYYVGYKDSEDKPHMESPKKMLGTSFENGAMIYYNPKKIKFPEPKDFSYDVIHLCDNRGMLIATHELDKAQTNSLLDEFFASEENLYKDGTEFAMLNYVKELRITSDEYKSLHLIMHLYSDNSGKYYIYLVHNQEKRLVLVGDENAKVFDEMFKENKEE